MPLKWAGLPLGQAVSLGIHESQSRLWENMILKSRPFWAHYYDRFQESFPDTLKSVSWQSFYDQNMQVKPSLIRVESDEVTYNLHIIVRFDLERRLLSGDLEVKDVPEAWNQAYQNGLGCSANTHADGFLQDVHWSCGLFGYFPTYALGNLYAAQLFDQAKTDIVGLNDEIYTSDVISQLCDWLKKHIHQYGSLYQADELVKKCCGSGLDAAPFMSYLKQKYSRP